MQDFDKKLEAVLESIKKLKKSEKKDKYPEISTLIAEQLDQTEDFASLLTTIENQLNNIYHIATKGILTAFSLFSEDKKQKFLESLASGHDRTLVYQIIARLIPDFFENAMPIFKSFCRRVTDDGNKIPSIEIQKKLKSAFILIPDLKDKPLKKILDNGNIDKNIILSIMPMLMDIDQNKQKNNYPLLKEKLVLHTSKVWSKLSEEEQHDFKLCIRPYLRGDRIDTLFHRSELKNNLSQNFIDQFFPDEKKAQDTSAKQITSSAKVYHEKPEKNPSNQPQKIDSKVPATANEINQKNEPLVNEDRIPNKNIFADSMTVLEDILSWVEESPVRKARQLLDQMADLKERQSNWPQKIEKAKKEINLLKQKNEDLTNENSSLNSKLQAMNEEIAHKNNEIKDIEKQAQTMADAHKEKITGIYAENEERQKRAISEMKNKIASRLQPIINNFYLLKDESDYQARSESQYRVFNNIIETLQNVLKIEVSKNE